MQREARGGDRTSFPLLVVESLTLQQESSAVELQPSVEHLPLTEHEARLLATRILDIVDHGTLPPLHVG